MPVFSNSGFSGGPMKDPSEDPLLVAKVWIELRSGRVAKAHKLAAPVLEHLSRRGPRRTYPKEWLEISKALCALDLQSFGLSDESGDTPVGKKPSKKSWILLALEIVTARSAGIKKAIVTAGIAAAIFYLGMSMGGKKDSTPLPNFPPVIGEVERVGELSNSPTGALGAGGSVVASPSPSSSISSSVALPLMPARPMTPVLAVDPQDSYDSASQMVWGIDPKTVIYDKATGIVGAVLVGGNTGSDPVYVTPFSSSSSLELVSQQSSRERKILPQKLLEIKLMSRSGRDLVFEMQVRRGDSQTLSKWPVRVYALSPKEAQELSAISAEIYRSSGRPDNDPLVLEAKRKLEVFRSKQKPGFGYNASPEKPEANATKSLYGFIQPFLGGELSQQMGSSGIAALQKDVDHTALESFFFSKVSKFVNQQVERGLKGLDRAKENSAQMV